MGQRLSKLHQQPSVISEAMKILEELAKFGTGRKMPSDALFAEGDAVCKNWTQLGVLEIDDEELCHNILTKFPCDIPGCSLTFDSLLQYELHYNSSHRYFCSECKKRLPSPHILELHVLETHDSFFLAQAERKPMYGCYIEDCLLKFRDAQERHGHCIREHKFPPDYRFDDFRKQKSKKGAAKSKGRGHVMKMEVDLPENKDEIKGSCKKKKKQIKQQGLENMMVSQEEENSGDSNENVQSNDKHLKQKKKNKNQSSKLPDNTDNSEEIRECDNTEEHLFKMAENVNDSVKEKGTDQKNACKGSFKNFTFGRGQGRGGRFTPWHQKNVSHTNIGDVERDTQIWESSSLVSALKESVMDT